MLKALPNQLAPRRLPCQFAPLGALPASDRIDDPMCMSWYIGMDGVVHDFDGNAPVEDDTSGELESGQAAKAVHPATESQGVGR